VRLPGPRQPFVEIFRSPSSIEAEVVRGLLDAHGIEAAVASTLPLAVLNVRFGHTEFGISVPAESAGKARDLIAGHLDEAAAGEVRRLREHLGPLEKTIGYKFVDLGLLEHAMTHRSRAHEDASGGVIDNESLEFLGDAVLGLVVADLLFHRYPTHSEGYKSKVKAGIVSAASLARLAEDIDLGRFVLLAGDRAAEASFTEDWKSALQEAMQAAGRGLPHYRLVSAEGPEHRKRFDVEVLVGGQSIARASGRSKKEAEQQAAKAALATSQSQ
jgi:ribonuclease-3